MSHPFQKECGEIKNSLCYVIENDEKFIFLHITQHLKHCFQIQKRVVFKYKTDRVNECDFYENLRLVKDKVRDQIRLCTLIENTPPQENVPKVVDNLSRTTSEPLGGLPISSSEKISSSPSSSSRSSSSSFSSSSSSSSSFSSSSFSSSSLIQQQATAGWGDYFYSMLPAVPTFSIPSFPSSLGGSTPQKVTFINVTMCFRTLHASADYSLSNIDIEFFQKNYLDGDMTKLNSLMDTERFQLLSK